MAKNEKLINTFKKTFALERDINVVSPKWLEENLPPSWIIDNMNSIWISKNMSVSWIIINMDKDWVRKTMSKRWILRNMGIQWCNINVREIWQEEKQNSDLYKKMVSEFKDEEGNQVENIFI